MEHRDDHDIRIKLLTGIAAVVFLAAAGMSAVVLRPPEHRVAEVVQDNEVLYTIDLDAAADREIRISYPKGSSNTILIRDGEIWVSEAECPDQTCVKMGKLRSGSLPIVCLPNHLIVRFQEKK